MRTGLAIEVQSAQIPSWALNREVTGSAAIDQPPETLHEARDRLRDWKPERVELQGTRAVPRGAPVSPSDVPLPQLVVLRSIALLQRALDGLTPLPPLSLGSHVAPPGQPSAATLARASRN